MKRRSFLWRLGLTVVGAKTVDVDKLFREDEQNELQEFDKQLTQAGPVTDLDMCDILDINGNVIMSAPVKEDRTAYFEAESYFTVYGVQLRTPALNFPIPIKIPDNRPVSLMPRDSLTVDNLTYTITMS